MHDGLNVPKILVNGKAIKLKVKVPMIRRLSAYPDCSSYLLVKKTFFVAVTETNVKLIFPSFQNTSINYTKL